MREADPSPVILGEVVVIGGGCYGSFYTRQLESARSKGRTRYTRLLVVDQDPQCQVARELPPGENRELVVAEWGDFLDRYLAERAGQDVPASTSDVIVPSPLMPHLMYHWLVRRARQRWPGRLVETRPVPESPRTPYDTSAPPPDHTRYVSFADWICPTHCTEPALCPVIRGPRTWEMSEALEDMTARMSLRQPTAGPILFECQHTVFGVGTFSVAAVIGGDRVVESVGRPGTEARVIVGTISSCHGAVNLLYLGGTGNR